MLFTVFVVLAHCASVGSSVITQRVRLLDLSSHHIPYLKAWEWQNLLADDHIQKQGLSDNNLAGTLLVLQHSSVYTLGTGTVRSESGPFGKTLDGVPLEYETVEIDRAGQATYHGPGQLVLYPILDLVMPFVYVHMLVGLFSYTMS